MSLILKVTEVGKYFMEKTVKKKTTTRRTCTVVFSQALNESTHSEPDPGKNFQKRLRLGVLQRLLYIVLAI